MRYQASGRIFVLVLIQTAFGFAQQSSGGGAASGGGSTGGGNSGATSGGTTAGRTTTTLPATTNNTSTTNTTPNNAASRPIFLSGRVLTQDGSVPPEHASIERVCSGATIREAYTDSKGYFSFQLGASNGIFNDASMDTPLFGNPANMNQTQALGGNSLTGTNALWGCELRAALPGYHSESISLANRRSMDDPQVGTIYITRMTKVEGYTTSATLALAPKDAKKAYEKGLNFSKHSKQDEAQAEFLHAVEVYPKLAAAWFELGKVYELRNHLDEARDAYKKATVADVNYVNPYERLYMLDLHDSQWQEAADLTEKVIRLNPYEFSGAYYANAVANFQLRKWDAAEKTARESADLKGTMASPKSLYLLGMILANKGNFSASAESFRSYLKTDPLAADRDKAQRMLSQMEHQLQAKQQAPAAPAVQ